jgi:hypothetical protein
MVNILEYYTFNELYFKEEEVLPNKYIWHLSSPKNRESILKNGILCNIEHYAVFANNLSLSKKNIQLCWPVPIDRYEYPHGLSKLKDLFNCFDFWKIDTTKIDFIWKVDPILRNDFSAYKLRTPLVYICTKNNIPPYAIELGKIKDVTK